MAADRREIAALKAKIRELERAYRVMMERQAVAQRPRYSMTYTTATYYSVGSTGMLVATTDSFAPAASYSPSADPAPCDPEPKQERQPVIPPGLSKPPVDDAELM